MKTPFPVRVFHCFTPGELRAVCREVGYRGRLDWPAGDTVACVHWLTVRRKRGYARAAVVCIGDLRLLSPAERLATLVHECVHVWQDIVDYIGEDEAGHETEAYTIDALFSALYAEWRKRPLRPALRTSARPATRARRSHRLRR